MKTQDYLKQIVRFQHMINLKNEEIAQMDSLLCSTPPTALNPNKVQTSMVGDRMSEGVAKVVDAQNEMCKMLDFYITQKNAIVSQIEHIGDTKSYIVLMNKYVLDKTNCEIACDLKCTERRVKQLHKKALMEFEAKYGDEYKNNPAVFL